MKFPISILSICSIFGLFSAYINSNAERHKLLEQYTLHKDFEWEQLITSIFVTYRMHSILPTILIYLLSSLTFFMFVKDIEVSVFFMICSVLTNIYAVIFAKKQPMAELSYYGGLKSTFAIVGALLSVFLRKHTEMSTVKKLWVVFVINLGTFAMIFDDSFIFNLISFLIGFAIAHSFILRTNTHDIRRYAPSLTIIVFLIFLLFLNYGNYEEFLYNLHYFAKKQHFGTHL